MGPEAGFEQVKGGRCSWRAEIHDVYRQERARYVQMHEGALGMINVVGFLTWSRVLETQLVLRLHSQGKGN